MNKPIMLVILDGFGYRKEKKGNAIAQANMPTWNSWLQKYPHTLLQASGEAVGLPEGYIGNSEVGHLTIGSGRITSTILEKFNQTIKDGSFFKNKIIIDRFKKLKEKNNALHLFGLLSDAGVHSHQDHLYAILKLAKQTGLKNVYIHAFLDGRDTPPKSATKYLKQLEEKCNSLSIGEIASIHGRFYAMDRDNNWNRIEKSYDTLTTPTPNLKPKTWQQVLNKAYEKGESDEFVTPTLLIKDGIIKSEDGIFFFNFRPDRARELTEAFINPNFNKFERKYFYPLSFFISSTLYKEDFKNFNNIVLLKKEKFKHTLLEILNQNNKNFLSIAETEKYAHVTYFFNGEVDTKLPNETRILIPSIKAKNYIDHPCMSAPQITQTLIDSLKENPKDFYLVNYANADMVGHSADLKATIKACECLDKQLCKLYDQIIEKNNGTIFITADHGNAEEMLDENNQPKSSHTTNPVPFIIIKKENIEKINLSKDKTLGISNIAPTILKYMNLAIPKEMNQKTIF